LDDKVSFIAFGQLKFTLLQEGLMVVEDWKKRLKGHQNLKKNRN